MDVAYICGPPLPYSTLTSAATLSTPQYPLVQPRFPSRYHIVAAVGMGSERDAKGVQDCSRVVTTRETICLMMLLPWRPKAL